MADVRAYLDGQREAPYDLLVEVFGPSRKGDPDKVIAEWELDTPHGWAEIYDYKDYAAQGDPRKVGEWHVNADNQEALSWIFECLESARAAKETQG